jgi:putative membrane protein
VQGTENGRRFPPRVFRDGREPDPRFSLANERTFLAWLRTSLAMFAAAFALEALSLPEAMEWRLAAAAVFVVLGLVTALQAWFGWVATERALRHNKPLPGLDVGGLLIVGVIVGAALVSIGMFM